MPPQPASGSASDVAVVEIPLDDAWIRDSGPSFVHRAGRFAGRRRLGLQRLGRAGVGRLGQGPARGLARWQRNPGSPSASSPLVNEGGGFHVDGEGTVLLTETVQLDPGRNPGATKESVEAEIHAALGTTKAIWLPRGLTRDYDEFGTRGHVDIVAAFAGPGTILLHRQDNPDHPDHAVYRQSAGCPAGPTGRPGPAPAHHRRSGAHRPNG